MCKIQITNYSEKAIAVTGDTKEVKEQLKQLGGCFNPRLTCGAGWIFSKKKRAEVERLLNGQTLTLVSAPSNATNKAEEEKAALWNEYKEEVRKVWADDKMYNYEMGKTSAIIRLENGGILSFEKPNIKTRFCFGYGYCGSYNESNEADNMADMARTSAEYFLRENLLSIDEAITRLEKCADNYGAPLKLFFCKKYDRSDVLLCYSMLRPYLPKEDITYRAYTGEGTEADRLNILNALKAERTKFEKRLRTYLKRYGLDKIKSWSYWADE